MNSNSPIEVIKASDDLAVFPVQIGLSERFCDLELRRHQLLIHFADDDICPASIVSLYQPSQNLFWWDYVFSSDQEFYRNKIIKELRDNKGFIYLSDNQIVHFSVGDGALWIRTSSPIRYKSIEDAFQKVLFILEKNLTELEQVNFYKWSTTLIFDDLKDDFFRPEEYRFVALHCSFGKLCKVAQINSLWHVQLEGAYNRKATVILRDKRENIEDPLLLTDDYYKNSRVLMRRNAYYLERGLPIPDYRYELRDVLIEDGSQK